MKTDIISFDDKNRIILQKPSGTIAISADLTAEQKKLYNGLLWIAKEEIKKDVNSRIYRIRLSELKKLLNKSETDRNNLFYEEKLEELMHKTAEYNILSKDKTIKGQFVLVSHIKIITDNATNRKLIEFELPEVVRERLVDPQIGMYANIDLVVVRSLISKHTITLYEIVKDYNNVVVPVLTIDKFCKIFNIKPNYRIDNIKRKVIEKALSEINNNPNIDFCVDYKLIKTGTSYTHIKFDVKPKNNTITSTSEESLQKLMQEIPEKFRSKSLEDFLSKQLQHHNIDYLITQIKYVIDQKPSNFIAYLKKSIDNDYANTEALKKQLEEEKLQQQKLIEEKIAIAKKRKKEQIIAYIDAEKNKIYNEYISLLSEQEKDDLIKKYSDLVLKENPKINQFSLKVTVTHKIIEDIVKENKVYQKRLEKASIDAEKMYDKEYQIELSKLSHLL